MVFSPVDALTKLGFVVQAKASSYLTLTKDGAEILAFVVAQDRIPSPAQLERFSNSGDEVTLFVVPKASQQSLKRIAETPGIALIAADGKTYFPGISQLALPAPQRPRGRIPWGKYALMRALMRTDKPRTQVELAQETGITQASVSMMLQKLPDHALRTQTGWVAVDRAAVWDAFLVTYPGAARVKTYWYSRQTFWKQAQTLREVALLSADGAADELAPWRSPEYLVAYADLPIDMTELGFSPATSGEANIELAIPQDNTIFSTARAWGRGIVDPAIAAWDLAMVGGPAAGEAIAKLREFMLSDYGEGLDH